MEVQIEIPHGDNNGDIPLGENNGDNNQTPSSRSIAQSAFIDTPEKKLALFALRLAIIKITTTRLSQVAFIWGSVILIGGFLSNLKPKDFWFVTAIVAVVEATRNFTRSCEFEWQYQSARTHPANKWTFLLTDVPLIPDWLQIFLASICVALSLMQLGLQDYGDDAQINEKLALNFFYGLVLADGLVFLSAKGYWAWRIKHGKLVELVRNDYEDLMDMAYLWHFFYDAYSQCIDGNIFDVLKMDLVSFAEKNLHSDSPDKQIIGAGILQQFIQNSRFATDTLRNIGSSKPVIDRLIEMLNFKDTLRLLASKIILKIASEEQGALLVATIPGAIESIASLLHVGKDSTDGRTDESSPTAVIVDEEYFKLLGLLILESLAKYHDNCGKIGNAPSLLAKIIDLTSASESLLSDESVPQLQIKTVHHTLQVVKILTTATGETTGEIVRRDISEMAFLPSNIKKILKYGQSHLELQMQGLQILTRLAMNEEAREKIVKTGSMLSLIIGVFFRSIVPEEGEVEAVCNEAGESLAMLLESCRNCERMLERKNVVSWLVGALHVPALKMNAMRILRCLCSYSNPERSDRLQIVGTMSMVLRTIMEEQEKEKLLEASLGIAIEILKFRNAEDLSNETPMYGIIDEHFVKKMVEILRRYENPKCEVPRMRIFVIVLAMDLMKYDRSYIELFKNLGMEQALMRTAETASDFEWCKFKL